MSQTKDYNHDLQKNIVEIESSAELILRKNQSGNEAIDKLANRIISQCSVVMEDLKDVLKKLEASK